MVNFKNKFGFGIFVLLPVILSLCPDHAVLSQVIQYDTEIYIDNNGRKRTEKTICVQINDKESNWLSHLEISHNPKQDFTLNYAKIIDSLRNTKRTLKKKEIITKNDLSNKSFYQDDLITEFDLYWNQYPYQIEYSYTIKENEFLQIAWWTPLLYDNVMTLKTSLKVDMPLNYGFHLLTSGNLPYKETITEERKQLYWQASKIDNPEIEIYAPSFQDLVPLVSVVPNKFKYGISGNLHSWSSFGIWFNKLNEGTDHLPMSEKIIIEKLVEGIDNKRDIVREIYHYLQDHTKYVNVAIDVGGLKSYPASYVCRNKYGDCKALTTYMKAMLKNFGIESYYAITNAGENAAKLKINHPSPHFNHVILTIPFENDTIWLENTANFVPFNYLGTFTQDRYALAVHREKSRLVRTPTMLPSEVLNQRNFEFTIDTNKIWEGNIDLNLRGSSFEAFRQYISNRNVSKQKEEILDQLNINSFELVQWKLIDFHRDSNNIKINVQGNCPSQIREIGGWEVINPLKIQIPNFEEPYKRTLNVRISCPISNSDNLVFEIKHLNKKEIKIPKGTFIKSVYGQYSSEYEITPDGIKVSEKFTLFANDIPVKEYSEFYSFIQSIIDHKKKSVILLK